MNCKGKGDRYERKVLNEWIAGDSDGRLGLRGAGSMSRGNTKIDLILIDLKFKTIMLLQAKNSKDWPQSRKDKHSKLMSEVLDGNYKVFAGFV